LTEGDLPALLKRLPVWSSREYERRLLAQGRGSMAQAIAWVAAEPVGRGMVLFPEHEEYSTSAEREGSAQVRDVFVVPERRRAGVATALMAWLEDAARAAGMDRIGLSVSLDDGAAPARALYERLGYRHAHGPYLSSATLDGDDGPMPVGGIFAYLVKDL
jgi:GNAT superfamily N-acetyltransferase